MSTLIPFDDHLAAIEDSCARLLHDASSRSLSDAVPTCPDWSLADLVRHHGGVVRWATAIVAGGRTENLGEAELDAVMAAPEAGQALLDWYSEAATALQKALVESPDAPALVFLADPPPPRQFWARRQAHEATIHRVDAMSAVLGHLPTAGSTGISAEFAADGIDELLTGFLPRRSSGLRTDEPVTVLIAPTDAEFAWTVRVSQEPPITTRGATDHPDATLTGTAAGLYLGLWNRGDEIAEQGLAPILGLWRDKVRIRWS